MYTPQTALLLLPLLLTPPLHTLPYHTTTHKQIPDDRPEPTPETLATLPTILAPRSEADTTAAATIAAPAPPLMRPSFSSEGGKEEEEGEEEKSRGLPPEVLAAFHADIHGEEGEKVEIPPEVAAAGASVGNVVARMGGGEGMEVVPQDGTEVCLRLKVVDWWIVGLVGGWMGG